MSKAKYLIALVLMFGLLFSTVAYAAQITSARCVVYGSTAPADSDGLAQTISDSEYNVDNNITVMVHAGSDVSTYNGTLEIVGQLPWSNSSTFLRMNNQTTAGTNLSTRAVTIDNIPEGIYTVQAKMTNMTNYTSPYSWALTDQGRPRVTSATCSDVSFTVGGGGVNLLPQQIEELTTPQKDNSMNVLIIGALVAFVAYQFWFKKK